MPTQKRGVTITTTTTITTVTQQINSLTIATTNNEFPTPYYSTKGFALPNAKWDVKLYWGSPNDSCLTDSTECTSVGEAELGQVISCHIAGVGTIQRKYNITSVRLAQGGCWAKAVASAKWCRRQRGALDYCI